MDPGKIDRQYRTELRQALETGRVVIGDDFRLECRFFFTGPGRLEIGDGVHVRPSSWDPNRYVTFSTYDENSVIRIGDGAVLEGTRMGCQLSLDIGAGCRISESSIMDTDFHSLDFRDRNAADQIKAEPVIIEENVRVGYGCHILRGVTIGAGTTVRPLSVVSRSLPQGIVAFGYPARLDVSRS